MPTTYKFPNNGYDVTIVKKDDIINSIDENIIDKDVALALIDMLEFDAACFIKDGKWTGLPFIGNVRIPKTVQMAESEEQKAIMKEAKDILGSNSYLLFRKQLIAENIEHIKQDRYYKYVTSMAVKRNRKLFNKLCKDKGDYYARVFLYTCKCISDVNNTITNDE